MRSLGENPRRGGRPANDKRSIEEEEDRRGGEWLIEGVWARV